LTKKADMGGKTAGAALVTCGKTPTVT